MYIHTDCDTTSNVRTRLLSFLTGDSQSDSSLSVTVSGGQPRPSPGPPHLQQQQSQPQNPNSVTYINPLHRSPNFEPEPPQGVAHGDGAQMNGHSQLQYPQQHQYQAGQPPLPGYAHRYPPPPYNYNHQYVNDRASSEPSHGAR